MNEINRLRLKVALLNPHNWNPRFSDIAKQTGISISTVFDLWKKIENKNYQMFIKEVADEEILAMKLSIDEKLKKFRKNKEIDFDEKQEEIKVNDDVEKKRTIRQILDLVIVKRKEQIKTFEDSLIQPMKDLVKFMEETKQGQHSVEHAIKRNEEFSEWLIDFLSTGKKYG